MDLGITLISAILVACCIVPFIAIGRSIKRKKTTLVKALEALAKQYQTEISEKELCGKIGIAFSEKERALLFYKASKDRETTHYIKLNDVERCTKNNVGRTIRSKSGNYEVIDKLELLLSFKKNKMPEVVLEFFNTDDNLQLDGELQLMDKWSQRIQQELKTIQHQYTLSAAS